MDYVLDPVKMIAKKIIAEKNAAKSKLYRNVADGEMPSDDNRNPYMFAFADSRSAEVATGRGKRFEDKYIDVERNVGVVRAAISVRYNR